MAKDIFQINAGVKLCSNCEYNLRCIECVYKKQYEELAEKHDFLLDEADRMHSELAQHKSKLDESEKMCAEIKDRTIKDLCKFIIDKSEAGVVDISELPSLAIAFKKEGAE